MRNVLSAIVALLLALCIPSTGYALCGDINDDGYILSNDVLMVARATISTINLTDAQKARADVVTSTSSASPDTYVLSNDLLLVARASLSLVTLVCNESTIAAPSGLTAASANYTLAQISWNAVT